MSIDLEADVLAIRRIKAVPSILDVVCRATGMGFAAVARVTDGQWVACEVRDDIGFGLKPGGELKLETTICDIIRRSGEAVVIDEVASDATWQGHPTPALYGFQSYISMPIVRADGRFFGTLCAIDPRPARLNSPEIVGMFRLFAELIALHLEADERLESSETSLVEERRTAELREQFIAVLGHDLRNPLAAINSGARMLLRTPLNDKAAGIVAHLQNSVARMSALIDNVLDFARGRLGGGFALSSEAPGPLEPVLAEVVAEFQASHPGRIVEAIFDLMEPVRCDRMRVGQLLSNLVGNALVYGAPDQPVRVAATTDGRHLEVSVANQGEPIPPATMQRLFQPFTRGAQSTRQQGLGLGLYIASEIARAHGGTLEASTTPAETRFTFRMPLAA